MTAFFARPEWLVLLPFLVFAAWRWRPVGLWRGRRLSILLLLLVVLAEVRLPRGGSGMDLWLLVDRSASARDAIEPRLSEIEVLLRRSKGAGDRLLVLDYSDVASPRGDTGPETFSVDPGQTRTGRALHVALGRLPPGRPARLLLLTDGYATEPLGEVGERLLRQGVPLDYRLFTPDLTRDYRTERVEAPQRVQRGEPFLVEIDVRGDVDRDVPLKVYRDGRPVGETSARVRNGSARVRVTERLVKPGAYRYTARVQAPEDPLPGNDLAAAWVEVASGPRVLLVTSYASDPLAEVLQVQGFNVDVEQNLARLTAGRLGGARVVILNNVPAYELPPDFLPALASFVRAQGGGLLMCGGRYSFGAGGYFGSPIDALLPVSLELRQEHRKLAVALAVVMDRSGSMGASVSGGITKMDLANEGAARSVELLGEGDAVTVFAVDSEAHTVVPLGVLGGQRDEVSALVRSIQSGGGGIYVFTGLKAAWKALEKAPYGQRHVILFADAADAEEPGEFRELLRRMGAAGMTVSVIGLGTDSDTDAAFLREVASLGQGRAFFTADPHTLPALFAQETVTLARAAFLDEEVGVRPTPGWLEIAARPLAGLARLDGYNLSYLRPGASAGATSEDEYAAPLVAFWRRGPGRAAALSFPMGGEHSSRVRAWPGYGDLVQTLTRWLIGESVPPGVGLRTRLDGNRYQVDLYFDSRWQGRLAAASPEILVAQDGDDSVQRVVWERLQPGHLRGSFPLASGRRYRGAVQVGNSTLPFGPVEAPVGAEWSFLPQRLDELKAVSAASGGGERIDLERAWQAGARGAPFDLRPFVLAFALLLILVEAYANRTGWRLPEIAWPRWRAASGKAPRVQVASAAAPVASLGRSDEPAPPHPTPAADEPSPSPTEGEPDDDRAATEQRRRRFRRAKRGRG